jgi:ERCC4-related helicase
MLTPHLHRHLDSYSDISPLIYSESIEFRAYQKNIADSAYNKNTLVILPTALGGLFSVDILEVKEIYAGYSSEI